ncbi:MAG: hypothetical protein IV097_14710 [Burkholderiaceae bacterium]|nr:hypothetical protein [Burkholderiaceae bacterium]
MLSEYKITLRLAESIAVLAAIGCLWFAFSLHRTPDPDFPLELASIGGFALLMITFLPACILGGEYVKTVRQPVTYAERVAGLNAREISAVVYWSPNFHKTLAALGVVVAVSTAISFGSVSWSTGDPPTPDDGIATVLYLSAIFLASLPVLASAARMPGTYAENLGREV